MLVSILEDEAIRSVGLQARSVTAEPSTMETIGAAFGQSNWPLRLARYGSARGGLSPVPGYSAMPELRGTKYETDLERFAGSRSPAETQLIMREWDRDEQERDVLARSGWAGTVASVGAGIADPTIFLPIARVFSGAAQGYRTLRLAGDAAATGAAGAAVGEAAMYATTPDYTIGDVGRGIATGTILSGLIGGGAAALLTRPERRALEDVLTTEREAWGAEIDAADPGAMTRLGTPSRPNAAGAAASDTRQLDLVKTPIGLLREKIADAPGGGVAAAVLTDQTARISPLRRVLDSPFVSAKRALVDLVETPYVFDENAAGIATTQGGALSRVAKLHTDRAIIATTMKFEELYTRMRFGSDGASWVRKHAASVSDAVGRSGDMPTFAEFGTMVDDAMRRGDVHEIPEVAEMARYLRSSVFDPTSQRAVANKMLPEDLDPKTAASYMMRRYNKQKIKAQRPEFTGRVRTWLTDEQGRKVAIRERLVGFSEQIDQLEEHMAKLDRQIVAAERRSELLRARGDERAMEAGALDRRAGALDAQSGRAADEIDDIAFEQLVASIAVDVTDRKFQSRLQAIGVRQKRLADLARRKKEVGRADARGDKRIETIAARQEDEAERLALAQETRAELEEALNGLRTRVEEELTQWKGKSAAEAVSALKARSKAVEERADDAPRLRSADTSVSKAMRRIVEGDPDRSAQELDSLANEITDRIIGGPDGRLPYDAPSGGARVGPPREGSPPRGPLAARQFMIPDAMIQDFLHTNMLETVQVYLRTMVPDILLTERFGDVDMTDAFRKLNEEHAALSAKATSEAERTKLAKQHERTVETLAALRDKVRGTYGHSEDSLTQAVGRTAAAVAKLNILTDLGGALFSAAADAAGPIFRYGFAAQFRHVWTPMAKQLVSGEIRNATGRVRAQINAMGIASETYQGTRANALSSVIDMYAPQTRFERGLDVATQRFNVANLMAPWTDAMRTISATVSGGEIVHSVEAVAAGTASTREIRSLAEAGIDGAMAQRIAKAIQSPGGGDVVKGVRLPNTGVWEDAGAREAFEAAVGRDVDIMVLTPGYEKPLFMSRPVAGLLLQYKSIVQAANERILYRGLQLRDGAVLQGMVASLMLGMFSQMSYAVVNDRELPKTAPDWIKEGMSRSGVLGWLGEINATGAKFSPQLDLWRLIGAERPEARFSNRTLWGQLLGPTAGKLESLVSAGVKAAPGSELDWSASDTRALRRVVFGQNLLYLRWLFDAGEDEVNETMGIEPLPRR